MVQERTDIANTSIEKIDRDKVNNEFLEQQLEKIQSVTYKRIWIFSLVLALVVVLLYFVVYHSVTSIISSYHMNEFLGPQTQKELKELYQELNIEKASPDTFSPELITKVRNYAASINQDMNNEQLKQFLDISVSIYSSNTLSLKIYLKNTIDRERMSSQVWAANAMKYYKFLTGKQEDFQNIYYSYKLPDIVETEIGSDIMNRLMIKDKEELTTKLINDNFSKIKDLFEKELYNDELFTLLRAVLKNKAELLKSALDSNANNLKEVQGRIKELIQVERENVKTYLTTSLGLQPYLSFVQRSLLSLLLVTVCITLLVLIKGEISVIAKTQSLVILAGGIRFSTEGISLFDAVDRLHSSGNASQDIKDIAMLLKERKGFFR